MATRRGTESTQKPKILIVDDEEASRESARMVLQNLYHVSTAETAERALDLLTQERFDLLLMDLQMPGIGGMAGLRKIRSSFPSLPIVMMTAYQTVGTAVESMKLGACDYLVKPFDVSQLREVVAKNVGVFYSTELQSCGEMRGRSPVMLQIFKTIQQVADKDVTVLVTGESGTGKELVAQGIHRLSLRQAKPLVVVNCAAIPENLMESELFGHERGSFTNADRRRLGQFEIAHGGTIILDEIGELSFATQSKLLRVLQNRSFNRVGGNESIQVNVRIIACTNRNLENEVAAGRFREDLYYRLNVVQIRVPPLRERREDILPLAEHFLAQHLRQINKSSKRISAEVAQALERYPWPGNVRELVNTMERIAVLSQQQEILMGDLPAHIKDHRMVEDAHEALGEDLLAGEQPFFSAVHELENKLIRAALDRTNGVQTGAADLLGISRRILKYKMDKLGIH